MPVIQDDDGQQIATRVPYGVHSYLCDDQVVGVASLWAWQDGGRRAGAQHQPDSLTRTTESAGSPPWPSQNAVPDTRGKWRVVQCCFLFSLTSHTKNPMYIQNIVLAAVSLHNLVAHVVHLRNCFRDKEFPTDVVLHDLTMFLNRCRRLRHQEEVSPNCTSLPPLSPLP